MVRLCSLHTFSRLQSCVCWSSEAAENTQVSFYLPWDSCFQEISRLLDVFSDKRFKHWWKFYPRFNPKKFRIRVKLWFCTCSLRSGEVTRYTNKVYAVCWAAGVFIKRSRVSCVSSLCLWACRRRSIWNKVWLYFPRLFLLRSTRAHIINTDACVHSHLE